jgi:hypothetical protein
MPIPRYAAACGAVSHSASRGKSKSRRSASAICSGSPGQRPLSAGDEGPFASWVSEPSSAVSCCRRPSLLHHRRSFRSERSLAASFRLDVSSPIRPIHSCAAPSSTRESRLGNRILYVCRSTRPNYHADPNRDCYEWARERSNRSVSLQEAGVCPACRADLGLRGARQHRGTQGRHPERTCAFRGGYHFPNRRLLPMATDSVWEQFRNLFALSHDRRSRGRLRGRHLIAIALGHLDPPTLR